MSSSEDDCSDAGICSNDGSIDNGVSSNNYYLLGALLNN